MSVNFSHVLSMFHQKSSQFTTAYLYRLPVRPATLLLRLVDLIFNHIAQNQNITYFPYTHTPEKYLDTLAQRCHCNCQFTHSNCKFLSSISLTYSWEYKSRSQRFQLRSRQFQFRSHLTIDLLFASHSYVTSARSTEIYQ